MRRSALLFGVATSGCSALSGLDAFELGDASPAQGGSGAATISGGMGGQGGSADGGGGAGACGGGLDSNPLNCGECGRDCLGGVCAAASCEKVALVTGQDGCVGVAASDSHVYWTTGTAGHVRRRAIGGGAIETPYSGVSATGYVEVTPTTLYWTEMGANQVWSSQLDGTGAAIMLTLTAPSGIALGDARLFTTEWMTGGRVLAFPLPIAAPTEIADGQLSPEEVAVDAQNGVYWTESAAHAVWYRPQPGVGAIIAPNQINASGIAVDDTHVYWASYGDGAVRRMGLGGAGNIEDVANGHPQTNGVAVTADAVFWCAAGDGTVWALVK